MFYQIGLSKRNGLIRSDIDTEHIGQKLWRKFSSIIPSLKVKDGNIIVQEYVDLIKKYKSEMKDYKRLAKEHEVAVDESRVLAGRHDAIVKRSQVVVDKYEALMKKGKGLLNRYESLVKDHEALMKEHRALVKSYFTLVDEKAPVRTYEDYDVFPSSLVEKLNNIKYSGWIEITRGRIKSSKI